MAISLISSSRCCSKKDVSLLGGCGRLAAFAAWVVLGVDAVAVAVVVDWEGRVVRGWEVVIFGRNGGLVVEEFEE